MSKKVHYSQQDIQGYLHNVIRGMVADNWRPDYIVGLTRGGLIPATMLSHYMNVPMHTLNVRLRDGTDEGSESNLWMAEDAFGYDEGGSRPSKRHNILVIDDINDQGSTINWIKQDWQSGCLPHALAWEDIWGANVRFAVLVNNEASEFKEISYAGHSINKVEEDVWCVFPWENWWA
jgi:hypoxanthine phosphoribosyltransferase